MSLAETPGVRRLAAALQAPHERVALRRALLHADLERALLSPGWSLKARLHTLRQLLDLVPHNAWPAQTVSEANEELNRLGMRMLSAAGFFTDPPEATMSQVAQAFGLLSLAAERALPSPGLAETALLRAQRLLNSPAAREALEADPALRRNLAQLVQRR